ncbi:hypothetical protein EDC56_3544 [Sinobacterium caligoides]|uniref:PsbP protein n=1 Tax=Sinobacterium caligoides TaxID=933926 RepID=A0A3N2DDS2_9GAMM|nr:hypothetical protein [Sinobacterium caligoides]ROR97877.1 hypothetical protein EDC56_3544 [Sinobacterium caligoides]
MRILLLSLVLLFSICSFAEKDQEFHTQILEPTGGKIEVPQNWFYRERHGGPYYVWILSKEDPDKGPYKTGVKIQSIMGIEEKSGQSPESFLRSFAAKKKKEVKVLSECKAQDQGLFTRICLETIEPAPAFGENQNFRIQYSLFWGNGMDLAVVMVSGTFEELWAENEQIFNSMQAFEFIDMKRFE